MKKIQLDEKFEAYISDFSEEERRNSIIMIWDIWRFLASVSVKYNSVKKEIETILNLPQYDKTATYEKFIKPIKNGGYMVFDETFDSPISMCCDNLILENKNEEWVMNCEYDDVHNNYIFKLEKNTLIDFDQMMNECLEQ